MGFDVGALLSSDLDEGYLRNLVVVVPIDDAARANGSRPSTPGSSPWFSSADPWGTTDPRSARASGSSPYGVSD
jgi:hypothetical protein